MKVTVTFGHTGVVVPCREGWTVRDLIQQANRRFRKALEQEGDFLVHTYHLEYYDGGILDPDDLLAEVVEDKDKVGLTILENNSLIAVYEEQEALQRGAASPSSGHVAGPDSPESHEAELSIFEPIQGGEIEVNSSTLMSETPLVVRRSSDSAFRPSAKTEAVQPKDLGCWIAPTGMSHLLTEDGGPEDGRRDPSAPRTSKIALSSRSLTRTVEISGDHGPLGIHVVPYCSSLSGRTLGLLIRGVEENSRSRREGIFKEDECIVKINEMPLIDKTFAQSQEIFRGAMRCPTVRLELLPATNRQRYEKSLIGQLFLPKAPLNLQAKPNDKHFDPESKVQIQPSPIAKGKNEALLFKSNSTLSPLASFANKKGGKRLKINLMKGPEGLGFTVVTRDTTLNGPAPILVKSILPRGAAVKDGRLQSGDWILEVNGVDVTGRTQEELVAMLRSTKQGDSVSLVVVREEDLFVPRELKGEQAGAQLLEEGTEPLVFEIPLNDSGSAGLGVSLKGNKSRETGEDLGIFIKSIIHGGAAYKDGRLHINDQLIAVNGESLLGRSNHEAMDTLRHSMSMEGNLRGTIQVLVMRATHQRGKENHETVTSDPSVVWPAMNSRLRDPVQPPMVTNSIYETSEALRVAPPHLRLESAEEEEDDECAPPLPPRLEDGAEDASFGPQRVYPPQSLERKANSNPGLLPHLAGAPTRQPQRAPVNSSKSMDLDESNVGALAARMGPRGQESVEPLAKDLGPTLGLKKSSSLESLQTAVSEVTEAKALFHKAQPHRVRGRGCNESFRAAIDKSYDGPSGMDDDLSDLSSGQETPVSSSLKQGVGDATDGEKVKKKKVKGKKKEKTKTKGADGAKKKAGDAADQDKKAKKKGFGLLRFGRNKEEKAKGEVKQKLEGLSQVELDSLKDGKDRTEAKQLDPDRLTLPNLEEDFDPDYERVDNFRDGVPIMPSPYYRDRAPSPPAIPIPPPPEEHIEGMYSTVNKQRSTVADRSLDRIQQLRREYKQAWQEGTAPAYEEQEARSPAQDCSPHRVPSRGYDAQLGPCYESVERQYASLPRQQTPDPQDYLLQPWAIPRDAAHFSAPQAGHHGYSSQGNYRPRGPEQRMQGERGQHLPHPQNRGPLRQDVPPSPPLPPRSARYESMNRGHLERFTYVEEQQQDPQQKSPVTAAV